ncbi:MAG: hypothetical protein LC640_09455 [Frankia sp.]|nr:hypothetical protein [Frankia sp.]
MMRPDDAAGITARCASCGRDGVAAGGLCLACDHRTQDAARELLRDIGRELLEERFGPPAELRRELWSR